ncbi:MAG: DUF3426 domain-containing protein [Smithella sp.]
MIIQCRQCRTKFRFADNLMEGDGIWMRCSHCQHVFFQDNPQAVKPDSEQGEKIEESLADKTLALHRTQLPGNDDDDTVFINNEEQIKNDSNQELFPEIEKPRYDENRNENSTSFNSSEDEDNQRAEKSPRRRFGKVLMIAAWIVAVVVVIPVLIYYFVFPQMGNRLLRIVNQYVDIGIRTKPPRPEVITGQVKLQDIRQRFLNNNISGQIRIVEGTAVNQADFPISRIAIKGEIVDAYAVVLGERVSYAGNVLTDEELTTLSEEPMLAKLARPEGNNNSNDRIMPNGMIPFMIVFAGEPGGVIKTTVKTVGAERLLSN